MTQKQLILALIKEDLVNTHLVCGLDALGLDSGKYFLRLNEIIFSLLKISDEDFMDTYIKKSRAVRHIDICENSKQLDVLVLRLYNMLFKKSKSLNKKLLLI